MTYYIIYINHNKSVSYRKCIRLCRPRGYVIDLDIADNGRYATLGIIIREIVRVKCQDLYRYIFKDNV